MVAHPEDLKRKSVEIFAGLARSYEKALDWATLYQDRRWKSWVVQRMRGREGDVVLDIGCGTLLLEERLAERGCKFVGLDLTPGMIRTGQSKNVPNVILLMNGDAEFLPFPDESFDSVVSCYVPKYVNIERFADELARVTKPGGTVVMYDFAKPGGMLAPFLELYIQGGLRIIGTLLTLAKRGESTTFNDLPWIVDGTTWDKRINRVMSEKGFEGVQAARLSGGVVFAYSGIRRRSP